MNIFNYKNIIATIIGVLIFLSSSILTAQAVPFSEGISGSGDTNTTATTDSLVDTLATGGDTNLLDTATEEPVVQNEAPVLPSYLEEANSDVQDALAEHLECSFSSLENCIPTILYYILYKPASWALVIAAKAFDYTLGMSIDNQTIDQEFVTAGWKIVRDFANMAFIFILLYTGIMTMFGQADWKGVVIKVVIIALLINFSLFFTKVVIDSGNILAMGIYNSLGSEPGASGGHRQISENIVAAFKPQNFVESITKTGALEGIIVFVIAAIVNLLVAWAFFSMALVFIGRIIGFWVLMILSPAAFISIAMSKGDKFHEWLHNLVGITFVAPVFLFFMYLILSVIQSPLIDSLYTSIGTGNPQSLGSALLAPVVVSALIVVAIMKAKDYAQHMAGTFGDIGSKIGGAVTGVVGGAALGGTAFAGRAVFGGIANRAIESGALAKMASSDNAAMRFAGRNLTFGADKLRNASFDVRGVGVVQKGLSSVGVKSEAGGKGGIVASNEKRLKEAKKKAKLLEFSDEAKEKMAGEDVEVRATKEAAEAREKRRDVLKEEKVAAEREANFSQTGQNVKATEANLKNAQESLEKTEKELKEALQNYEVAKKTGDQSAMNVAQQQIQAAQSNKNDATQEKQAAQSAFETAKAAHKAGAGGKLEKIKKNLEDAEKELKEAKDLAKSKKDKLDKQIKELEQQARGSYAESAASFSLFTTEKEMKKFIDKIREGKKDQDKLEKIIEELAEKKMKEKEKKEGGGDHH